MNTILQDLRHGTRSLLKSPGFAVLAVATLALGIGANTIIFTLADALILKDMPGVQEPHRLVWISNRSHDSLLPISYPDYLDYQKRTDVFESVAASRYVWLNVGRRAGKPERLCGQAVTTNFFATLGITPVLGRDFRTAAGGESSPECVISERYWASRLGRDPGTLGSQVFANGRLSTIVGIVPASFLGFDPERNPEIWITLSENLRASETRPLAESRDSAWLTGVARVKQGLSLARISESLTAASRSVQKERSRDRADTVGVASPLQGWVPPGQFVEIAAVLALGIGATAVVLLISATNFAGLLLGRASGLRVELALRMALGAPRHRIVRRLLAESLLLSVCGGVAGLALSAAGLRVTSAFLELPPGLDLSPNAAVLTYAVAVALATGFAFGIGPALAAARRDPARGLSGASGGGLGSRRALRLRRMLVVAQISLSLVMLTTAGLFVRSLASAKRVGIGSERGAASRVVTMAFDLKAQGYSRDKQDAFYRQVFERIAAQPRIESVSFAEILPLSHRGEGDSVRRDDAKPDDSIPPTFLNHVSPGYLSTLGIRLLAGRDFSWRDDRSARTVALVNETLARRFWPGENPIGRRLVVGDRSPATVEVIGVTEDGKYLNIAESTRPFLYLSMIQAAEPVDETTLLVRSTTPGPVVALARKEIGSLDSGLALYNVKTFAEALHESLSDRREATGLIAAFGLVALFLAASGVYGLVAYIVSQSTREIGLRVALGATPGSIQRLFARRTGRLAVIALAGGLLLSAGVARLLAGMLFGISPMDAATLVGATVLLAATALLATYIPTRRATKVDPMIALRSE